MLGNLGVGPLQQATASISALCAGGLREQGVDNIPLSDRMEYGWAELPRRAAACQSTAENQTRDIVPQRAHWHCLRESRAVHHALPPPRRPRAWMRYVMEGGVVSGRPRRRLEEGGGGGEELSTAGAAVGRKHEWESLY